MPDNKKGKLTEVTDPSLLEGDIVDGPQEQKPADYHDLSNYAQGKGFTVTSTTGGEHNTDSAHYKGRAIDIRTHDKKPEDVEALMADARSKGYIVRDERVHPNGQQVWSGSHIHLQLPEGYKAKPSSSLKEINDPSLIDGELLSDSTPAPAASAQQNDWSQPNAAVDSSPAQGISTGVNGQNVQAPTDAPVLSPQDLNNKIFGTDVEGQPMVQAPTPAPQPTAGERTKKAVDVIANDYLQSQDSHHPDMRGALQANPAPGENNPLSQLTDPAGDPTRTARYFKYRKDQMIAQMHSEVEAAKRDNPAAEITIPQEYNKKIAELDNATKHLTSLQLFQKEYADKPLTPAESVTQLDALDKQEQEAIKNTNKRSFEDQKPFEQNKADDERRDKIATLKQHFDAERNKIRSQSKWDGVRLGMEQKRLMGDKQAEKDAQLYDAGKPISPERKYQYQLTGNEVKKTGLEAAKEQGQHPLVEAAQPHIESDKQIENANIDYLKSKWADQIANAKYNDEGYLASAVNAVVPIDARISQEDVNKYGKEAGLTPSQIAKINPDEVPTPATIWQQFAKGALNTAAPIYERGVRAAVALTGGDNEAVNEHFQNGWENQRGLGAAVVGNIPSDQNTFHNIRGAVGQMMEGAGGLSTFMPEVTGVAGAIKGAGLVNDAEKAEKLANFGVMAFAGYNSAYHDANEVIGDKPDDEWKRQAYALTNGMIEGAIFSISPKADLAKSALGLEEKSGQQLLNEIKNAKGIEFLKSPELKATLSDHIMAIAKENGSQVGLATANELSKHIINTIANPQRKQDLSEDVKNTAISTSLAMMIPSIMGGIGHVNNQTHLNEAAMFELGTNPDKYTSFISQQLADGKISPDQAQTMHDGILTMKNVISQTPTANIEGAVLTPDQVKAYAFNQFQEHLLEQRVDKLTKGAETAQVPVDKAQLTPLNKRISELQTERAKILKDAGTSRLPAPVNEGPKAEGNQGENLERSVATEASSEEQAPAAKKVEEKLANSEKEDISLSPLKEDNSQTQKTNDHAESRNVEDQNSGQVSSESNNGRQESANPEETGNSEGRNEPQENRQLSPEEKIATTETVKAAPETEQPLSVKKKRKRLFVEEEEPTPVESKKEEKNDIGPPQPAKPIHEMTSEELRVYHGNLKEYNKNLEKNILGKDYPKYEEAKKISNSDFASKDQQAKADETISSIEGSLTEKERNALFGIGAKEGDIVNEDHVLPYINRIEHIEISATQEDLAKRVSQSLIDLNEAPSDISKMSDKEKVALSGLAAAKRVIDEKGYDGAEVTALALKESVAKYADPSDAELMLSRYFEHAEKSKFTNKKRINHASPQSEEQQQKGTKQSGEPEHARAEQAGSETTSAETKNSDSNIGGEKKEEVAPPAKKERNQSKKGWSLTAHNNRREKALRREPQSVEEHVLQSMLAMNDKDPAGKWSIKSLEKDLPKGAEEKRSAKQFASDHPDATPIDVWAHQLAESVGEKYGSEGVGHATEQEIKDMVIENISKFPTKTALLERMESVHEERMAKAAEADENKGRYDRVPVGVDSDGKEVFQTIDTHEAPTSQDLADHYSSVEGHEFVGYNDEGHPLHKPLAEGLDAIDNNKLTDADEQAIVRHFEANLDKDGKVNWTAVDAEALKKELSPAGQKLVDDIQPFNESHEQSKELQSLEQKTRKNERSETTAPDNAGSGESAANKGEGQGIPESNADAQPAERPEEKRRSVKDIDLDLQKEKASLHDQIEKGKTAEKQRLAALKSGDKESIAKATEEVNKRKDFALKKQAKIERLDEERAQSLKDRQDAIREAYKTTADKIRSFGDDLAEGSEGMLSTAPLITAKALRAITHLVADAVELGGNLHIAIDSAMRKWVASGEKPLTDEQRKELEEKLEYMRELPKEEPKLPVDHEEYAKDILADIQDGAMTYEDAVKEVRNEAIENRDGEPVSESVSDKIKSKILHYIDWHTKDKRQQKAEPNPVDSEPSKKVESFETSQGSKYEVLPDGRTKRFKTASGEDNEPQDLIVFAKFKDPEQQQRFLRGIQDPEGSGSKVYVIDQDGKIYDKNEDVKGKDVKLALVDTKEWRVLETAGIKTDPTKGYNTFDQRRFTENGKEFRESHIGNEVTKINYAEPEKKNSTEPSEPILPIDHEEYGKNILSDILSGRITREDAKKIVADEVIKNIKGNPVPEDVAQSAKEKIMDYIDWHIQNDVTSIKNETTRLRRSQFGLTEELQPAKKEFGETWEEAKDKIENNPQTPLNLIEELSRHPRPLTDVENAVLLHHQNTKEIELVGLNDSINKAAEEGREGDRIGYKVSKARVLDELQQIYDVNKAVGTENARGLASRRMMSDRKYSLVNMIAEKRATANDGKALSEEQQTEIENLHKKIKETQAAFDDYMKGAESQIVDLQRNALTGKVRNKNVVSAKLREWADKIEQANKNAAYSSPIPITPKMVAQAMRLIADGIDKGEDLLHLVKKAVDKIREENPDADALHIEKEINKHLIDAQILDPSADKNKAVDAESLFSNGKLDRKAVALKVEAERAKAQYDINIKRDQERELSTFAKVQNTFIKWQRAFKLSNPLTMGKLMMAGITRLTTTPLEDIVGGAYSMVLPQLAKGAIGEGGGLNINETARAYKNGIIEGMRDASDILSKKNQGKSDLDVLFGKAGELPPEAIDFFGQLHSATKAPIKRSIFERSLERRMRRNIANGVDVSDPMVQTSIMTAAYKDANRAIFMQDNKVAEGWRALINNFEKVDPKTGKPKSSLAATALQWMIPFVKVPSNIVAEVGTHIYGLPVGAAKLVHAAFTDGIKNLSGEEKDIILRNLKKGTLGAAAMALGYFNPQNFGGYYQPGQKRDEDDAEALGLKLFDTKIPSWFVEAPIYQAMQFGATVRRVSEHYVHGEEEGIPEGLLVALLDVAQTNPLAGQPLRVGALFKSKHERAYYFGELAKSTVDPAILTYLAKVTDPADEGNPIRKMIAPENHRKTPHTTAEHIKSGLPFLREDLDEK